MTDPAPPPSTIPVYCISGLGATRHLFDYLAIPGCDIRPLDWLAPVDRESIRSYAARLAEGITEDPLCVLLGVSFGGPVALEMARVIRPRLVILVSSIRHRREIPWYFRLAGALRLHRLFPMGLIRHLGPILRFFMGASMPHAESTMDAILATVDLDHTAWGVDRLLLWPGTTIDVDTFHLHGSADRVFPLRYVHPDAVLPNGSHVMILNRAAEVGDLIAQHLRTRY